MAFSSSAKVVVITGASSGIGAGLAKYLSKFDKGKFALVLVARREEELQKVAESCLPNCKSLIVKADVTKRNEVEYILTQAKIAFGRVNVWVNNVGLGIIRPVLQLTDDDVDKIIAANLKSALYGMQIAIKHFQDDQSGHGHCINISSVLGRIPYVGLRSMYSASKAALNSLTTNVRIDLKMDPKCQNIHLTTILPGMVQTGFSENGIGNTQEYTLPYLGPMPSTVQSVEDVCKVIADVINYKGNAPPRDVYTNPEHKALVRQYYNDIALF
ncbi:unnamed protein product [Didymodactylos carnosus]|uniref:Uncharacterized protein n=2 Tax=Didymodactylos carnosus TaxID=1234261 RepID=A0A8S2T7N1_9BILA|nr:unnamed protein product [Didymodactylos carnosus]CAF4265210.1 unnamed protein product [Didymodactylos carnosus]